MLKILQFGRFDHSLYGGMERHIDQLVLGLQEKTKIDCLVTGFNRRMEMEALNNVRFYKIPTLATLKSTALSPSLFYWAHHLYQQNNYDLVHLHLPNPMAHLASYVIGKKARLAITWHSDIIRQKKLLRFYSPLLKHLLNRADIIITATPQHFAASTQLAQFCNHQRFAVIPFGLIPHSFFELRAIDRATEIRRAHLGKKIIFALGRHVYYKGFEYLLRALKPLDNTVLLLGGIGPLTPLLKKLASELQLQDKIKFLGRLQDDELPAYYHACDVFCMPSVAQSEAFGLVQLEAMICKKPVVCCELDNGVTYVNQHNQTGLVVPPRDVEALSLALQSLLANELLCRQMGEFAFNRVLNEFSYEGMCKKTLDIYQSLCESPAC